MFESKTPSHSPGYWSDPWLDFGSLATKLENLTDAQFSLRDTHAENHALSVFNVSRTGSWAVIYSQLCSPFLQEKPP